MLKLEVILVIIIGLIGPVFNLNSTDLCYSTKLSACKGNYSYQCAIDICSLNKEACDNYNKHKRSYTFRSLHPLIKFQKEIKLCEFIKSKSGIDLKKYCLNRNDCFEANKLRLRCEPNLKSSKFEVPPTKLFKRDSLVELSSILFVSSNIFVGIGSFD